MEWLLLGVAVVLSGSGWLLAWHHWRRTINLKALLGESIALTDAAIAQNQNLLDHNQTMLNDLTATTILLGDTARTTSSPDPTVTTTLH